MIRYALPLAVTAAVAFPAAAEVQVAATGPVVALTVHESVEAEPDIATVGAGVTTQARTAVEAMRANATAMRAVVERIKALGIAERDIQTTGINLGAMYDYNQQTQRQVFRGYQASNRVSVKLREIDHTGPVLDALVEAGATDLNGPDWSIDDPKPARAARLGAAIETAHAQALDYARAAGFANVRLLEINEALPPSRPMPMMRMAQAEAASDASTPVQPGMIEAGVTVTVTYEMTR